MKTYLNRDDRDHLVAVLVMWDYISNWIAKATCLDKAETKNLKTARTLLRKTSDHIVERMDQKFAHQLIRELRGKELMVIDRTNMELKQHVDCVNVAVDDLYDLASYALEECVGCQRDNIVECPRYQLFLRLALPVAQEETDGCPFKN